MSRDIDEAFDVRIEPWDPKLPGCKGECQQGRRPCLSPEECMPDSLPFTRSGCLMVLAVSAIGWVLVIGVALYLLRP
jgi:hypothetical protein